MTRLLALALAVPSAQAAAPTLEALLPAGGMAGSEFKVEAVGKAEPWPVEVWCSHPDVRFVADAENENTFEVTIAGGAAPGACLVRTINGEGASEPRTFVVGTGPEVAEAPDHETLTNPQRIDQPLPLVVNGRLAKGGEADFYALALEDGQHLRARLDGHSLGSPIDPHLFVYDAAGARLAMANDSPGALDPCLDFVAPSAGDYTLAVMAFQHPPSASVTFHGHASAVYRLALSWGEEERPAPDVPPAVFPGAPPFDGPVGLRGEVVPLCVREGERWLLTAEAEEFDPVLRIVAPGGELVKEADDTRFSDAAEFLWKVGGDGIYGISVRDRFGRSGQARLGVNVPVPTFSAGVERSTYEVEAGGETKIEIDIRRELGHEGGLAVQCVALPAGVTAEVGEVSEGDAKVELTLRAADDAPAASGRWNVGVVEAAETGPSMTLAAYAFPNAEPRGTLLVPETADLWLTVRPKDPAPHEPASD
ncbi:hypothetical protein BH23VER1_BH23VER1_02990 [soil metagenome]